MAFDHTDWAIDATTKAITYIGDDHTAGTPTYASAIEWYRGIIAMTDDPTITNPDDELYIVELLPLTKDFETILNMVNGFTIGDTEAEHIYGGSITLGDGTIYEGLINYGSAGVVIQIIQDGAVLADDWWNDNGGLNAVSASGISHQFMLKVSVAGVDIDGRKLICTSRSFGNSYSEFVINQTGRGVNTIALSESDDLNNNTVAGTVSGWTGITNTTEGYAGIDISGDGSDEFYYSEWNTNQPTRSINEFYERMKWLTRDESVSTIYGLNGELFRGVTHEIVIDTPTGTFSAFEAVSWSGGTGQMLAIDSTTAGTKMWIQLLTGSIPVDNDVITGVSTATAAMNVTITERSISTPFIGISTGTALIGAYGIGLESADVTSAEKFTPLDASSVTPPNNVNYNVGGLDTGGDDYVLVGPWDGSTLTPEGFPALTKNQMQTDGTLYNSATTTTVTMASIPTDTPASGTFRVLLTSGVYERIPYTSYTGAVFTITSYDFSGDPIAATAQNAFVSYIDKIAAAASESFTVVYLADRDLAVLVRDGGATPIKQFLASGKITNVGGSITAIRTSDA